MSNTINALVPAANTGFFATAGETLKGLFNKIGDFAGRSVTAFSNLPVVAKVLIVATVLVTPLAAYFLFFKKEDEVESQLPQTPPKSTPAPSKTTPPSNDQTPPDDKTTSNDKA